MRRTDSFEETLMLGKIEGRRRRGNSEDEMVGWHHQHNGHKFEQTGIVKDREPWHGVVQGVSKSQT